MNHRSLAARLFNRLFYDDPVQVNVVFVVAVAELQEIRHSIAQHPQIALTVDLQEEINLSQSLSFNLSLSSFTHR